MEQPFLDVVIVPSIVILVYWIINMLKIITNNNEKIMKLIPVIANVLGAILGVVIFLTMPQLVIADNLLFAIIVGGASGLAATGTNQIFKQLSKKEEIVISPDKDSNSEENNNTDNQ